jgi:heme A synthase
LSSSAASAGSGPEVGVGPISSAGGADTRTSLRRFRTLTTVTIVATLALIVIGGIVRVSDSGLGCGPAGSGTHGWPLCTGSVIPSFLEGETAVEFTHRAAAGVVGILIAALFVVAWRSLRDRRELVRGTAAALGLVLVQAALGGLTVEKDLDEVLVAAHLLLAMLLLGLLLWIRARATPPAFERAGGSTSPELASGGLRRLSAVAALLVLATIVVGGYVAGTEGEGTANEPALGAHLACGQEFPGCLGKFMPFGTSSLVDAHLTHRLFMYLAALAVLGLAVASVRSGRRDDPLPLMAAGVLIVQVMLGAINVWEGKHAGLIVAHLTVGTLLWALLALTWIRYDSARA